MHAGLFQEGSTLPDLKKKKSAAVIFHQAAFSFVYSLRSLWHDVYTFFFHIVKEWRIWQNLYITVFFNVDHGFDLIMTYVYTAVSRKLKHVACSESHCLLWAQGCIKRYTRNHDMMISLKKACGLGVRSSITFIPKIFNRFKIWTHAPEPLFHNLSPMNTGIVRFEYAHAIREKEIHWWNNLAIQESPWPDQLQQPQVIPLSPLSALGMMGHHFTCSSSYPEAPFTL